MPNGLYEHDVLAWAEGQAALLRRLTAGERLNEAVDWPNLIEEVEAVGRSELRICESLLSHALAHLLRLHGWPQSQAAAHWRSEVAGFLADARRSFTPSMRQRIDLAGLYADALYQIGNAEDDSGACRPAPTECPFTVDGLLASRPDVKTLVGLLSAAATPDDR